MFSTCFIAHKPVTWPLVLNIIIDSATLHCHLTYILRNHWWVVKGLTHIMQLMLFIWYWGWLLYIVPNTSSQSAWPFLEHTLEVLFEDVHAEYCEYIQRRPTYYYISLEKSYLVFVCLVFNWCVLIWSADIWDFSLSNIYVNLSCDWHLYLCCELNSTYIILIIVLLVVILSHLSH